MSELANPPPGTVPSAGDADNHGMSLVPAQSVSASAMLNSSPLAASPVFETVSVSEADSPVSTTNAKDVGATSATGGGGSPPSTVIMPVMPPPPWTTHS